MMGFMYVCTASIYFCLYFVRYVCSGVILNAPCFRDVAARSGKKMEYGDGAMRGALETPVCFVKGPALERAV